MVKASTRFRRAIDERMAEHGSISQDVPEWLFVELLLDKWQACSDWPEQVAKVRGMYHLRLRAQIDRDGEFHLPLAFAQAAEAGTEWLICEEEER
jgi:hypothetical protein